MGDYDTIFTLPFLNDDRHRSTSKKQLFLLPASSLTGPVLGVLRERLHINDDLTTLRFTGSESMI